MPLEAYSATKPPLRYRGWVSAIALLLVSTSLAWTLTRSRSEGGLAERVHPAGWDISFRAPAGFARVTGGDSDGADVCRYRLAQADRPETELAVWRVGAGGGLSATQVCERILEQSHPFWFRALFGPSAAKSLERLGGYGAVELADPSMPMIVRSIVLQDGSAYAVSVRSIGGPIEEPLYRIYTQTCRSLEVNAGFHRGRVVSHCE